MNNNTFSIDYTERKLVIEFNGESHSFDLNQGDTGDFWHGFEDKEGRMWDVNFYQEDEASEPSVVVYPCFWGGDENGNWEIDTGNPYELTLVEKVGDIKDYFGPASIVTEEISIKEKLQAIIDKINDCGIGAWNADLENTIEAVALEDYYGDVENSDNPTIRYNGWYEDLEKLLKSL